MKQALLMTLALTVLLTPTLFAQDAATPELPPMEAALDLPEDPAPGVAAPGEPPSCLAEQQRPLEQGGHCEDQCLEEYAECVIFCSKNPCLVACETVLDICLGNCH
jgi:hypothetical protein